MHRRDFITGTAALDEVTLTSLQRSTDVAMQHDVMECRHAIYLQPAYRQSSGA
jgi:hypothetical protein